jgi:prevent-host-death family protein
VLLAERADGDVVQQCLLFSDEGNLWRKMLTYSTAAARRALASIIRKVQLTGQRVVITRYGRPLVAIVPMEDLKRSRRTTAAKRVSRRRGD